MTVSVHNPIQYMDSLRQIIAQGRKRIGLLVGAGAPLRQFRTCHSSLGKRSFASLN